MWYWSGVFCSVYADCVDDSSAGSCACLAQGCRCGDFFPNFAVFALVLGNFVLAYRILALPLLFLGYAYGVAFFSSVCLSSAYLYPAVAGLVDFSCGPHLWWFLCVCWVLSEAAELSLLSLLLLGVGLAIVEPLLVWLLYLLMGHLPRRVLLQVTLRGSTPFLALVVCPAPAVSLVGLVVSLMRCLVLYLVPCSSSRACGLRSLPCCRLPLGGFSNFLSLGA